jgi:CheY-like chemotaxis protein
MNALITEDYPLELLSDVAATPLDDISGQLNANVKTGLKKLLAVLLRKRLPLVVLIEDEDDDAQLFRNALRFINRTVEFMHFRDGQQAIDFFQGNGAFSDRERFPLPELTVLDIQLTGSCGIQILREIRKTPALKHLPVVALTASDDADDLREARALEIDDWIIKPSEFLELVEIVRQLSLKWLT